MLHEKLTGKIIGAFYTVYNEIGYGFLERVYENALMLELKEIGLKAVRQHPIEVFYKEKNVGNYFADILVEDKVIIELKTASKIIVKHELQLQNYLKATDIGVGLILNFAPDKPETKRKIFDK